MTTSRPSNISAASPTATPTTIPTRRRRALSPTPLSRSATTTSTASRNTEIKPDPDRAREMFSYAASYFRDPDAQYYLARLYLDGTGAPKDPRQAARWFGLSAQKGQCQAQAMLGAMLFAGDHVPRQAARGLMWLALAKDSAARRAARLDQQSLRERHAPGDRRRARARRRLSQALAGDPARVGRRATPRVGSSQSIRVPLQGHDRATTIWIKIFV